MDVAAAAAVGMGVEVMVEDMVEAATIIKRKKEKKEKK